MAAVRTPKYLDMLVLNGTPKMQAVATPPTLGMHLGNCLRAPGRLSKIDFAPCRMASLESTNSIIAGN